MREHNSIITSIYTFFMCIPKEVVKKKKNNNGNSYNNFVIHRYIKIIIWY